MAAVSAQRGLWRSRWAAIGAAVAVTLGGGGIFVANAAASPASSVVTIDPLRILDTRTDVGLPGPFVSAVSQKLRVTGGAVPAGATGVLLNVTAVGPTANGFLSVRPGDATGAPSTSSLNFNAGDIVPNSVQVGLPTSGANAGQIDITYDAFGVAGPTTEVLIDVVGYMIAGGGGTPGPTGPPGANGATGPGYDLAQVVWVATSGGDFDKLSTALASITDASASKPYVIKIAPGVYTETTPVAMKSFVDVEGSGEDVTTISCNCPGLSTVDGVLGAGNFIAEIRHLTIRNTSPTSSIGVVTTNVTNGSFSMLHVTVTVTGTGSNTGVVNVLSSPTMTNVTATATGGTNNFAVNNAQSSPTMTNVTATATGGTNNNFAVNNQTSSPTINNLTATAAGGVASYGVRNVSSSKVLIRDSLLTGALSVFNEVGSTVKIFNTVFNGVTFGVGSASCFNAMDTGLGPYVCA